MSTPDKKPLILMISVPNHVVALGSDIFKECELISKEYSQELLEKPLEMDFALVICGFPPESFKLTEIGQSLKMHYPRQALFLVTETRQDYHRKNLQKNGFTDVFFLPGDAALFKSQVQSQISQATHGRIKSFRNVQLIDIGTGTHLGFDLYLHLPVNNKKIIFVPKTDALDENKLQKLKKYNYYSGHVSEDQMSKFYEFTAQQLKKMGQDSSLSETERDEKRQRAVRDILTGILSDSSQTTDSMAQGRQIMNDCQEIIKSYIVSENSDKGSWYEKLLTISNQGSTTYSHASNTSTIAALVSIATGIGDPKEIALAALLHDIGLSDIPSEICLKSDAERTPDEKKIYEQHPSKSIAMIKERKIIVSEKVVSMIEEHHERFDGQGYPQKMPGPRINKESQILHFADLVDEMIEVKPGKPNLTIIDAMKVICTENLKSPMTSAIDPQLLKKVQSVLTPPPTGDKL